MSGEFTTEQLRAMMMEVLGGDGVRRAPGPGADEAATLAHYKRLSNELKDASVKTQSFSKVLKGGIKDLVDITDDIKNLNDQISSMTEIEAKRELIAQRDHLQQVAREENTARLNRNFGIGLAKLTSTIGTTAAGAAGTFVRGLQSGGSGITLASGLMSAAVDVAGAGAATAGAGLSAAGSGFMAAGGKAKVFGAAMAVAGALVTGFGSSASKLAKFGIEVLTKEVEKSIKAYNDATASGALFAGGMKGLRDAANEAGLDLEQFSQVLVKHSTDLSALGMGVTEGAKRMGGALKAGGDTMQRQLINLGVSIEDQAGMVAETMKQMRGSGGPMQASNAQVAAETMKYAENLKIISAITGEDARKKTAQAQEQNQILAFQQKMAGKSESQRAQINAAMATMTEQEKKNFRDRVVLGTVVNKEGAIYEATVAGAREKGQAALDLFENNNLTAESNANLNAQYGDQIKESILAQTSLGAAAYAVGGVLTGVATAGLDAINQAGTYTKDSVTAATEAVTATKNLIGGFADVALAAQKLKTDLGNALTPAVDDFVKFSAKILEEVRSMIKGVTGGTSGDKGEGIWDKTKRIGGAAVNGALVGGQVGALAGAAGGTVALPVVGTVAAGAAGAVIGGLIGGIGNAVKEAIWGEPGKADGGIAKGPASGFIEKLHGTEAVVPLPDGKTIPVAIKSTAAETPTPIPSNSGSDTAFTKINDLLSRQIDAANASSDTAFTKINDLLSRQIDSMLSPKSGSDTAFTKINDLLSRQIDSATASSDTAFTKINDLLSRQIDSMPNPSNTASDTAFTKINDLLSTQLDSMPIPKSGSLEKLYGIEAAIPLPDVKNIPGVKKSTTDETPTPTPSPVEPDTSSTMLRDLLSRQLDLMQKTFDQTTEMLSAFNDSKQLQQQLVNNSY